MAPDRNDSFPIDLDQVRAYLAAKEDRCRAEIDARFARATREVGAIVAQIASQVNPHRVYQWGSLLERRRFSQISDIDIAVEGLRGPEEYFRTLGIALEGATIPVDVVELEKLPRDVAERIRNRGRMVYERIDR